MNFCALRFSNS